MFFAASYAVAQGQFTEVKTPVSIFEKGYIQVIGESEAGQSRYRAIRAAEVIAQRNLLEVLQGLTLYGTTSVNDGSLRSEKIRTSVNGFLRGAIKCGEEYNVAQGYARVCMRLHLRGKGSMYDVILPLLKDQGIVPEAKPQFEVVPAALQKMHIVVPEAKPYDGLIVDVRNYNFRPAIQNRILTESEKVVFDQSRVLHKMLVERGCGGFTTDENKAKVLLESWGSKFPLTIKCTKVINYTDAVVSDKDATVVYVNDQKTNMLAQARVVFLLK